MMAENIADLVKEHPGLNDSFYKEINSGVYISRNEVDMVFDHWQMRINSGELDLS